MVYAFLGAGIALLWIGSEAVQRGGIRLFRMLGRPPAFAGLMFVSLAMCAPELSVAVQASARGMPDIALGDVVGSAIANILLVFGCGALMRPMPGPPRTVFRDGGTLFFASIALTFILLTGLVGTVTAAILLAGWVLYLIFVFVMDWRRPSLSSDDQRILAIEKDDTGILIAFLLLIGIVSLFFGAKLLIDFARLIARDFHAPQIAVALTIVAFGTSLPELAATIASAARGHSTFVAGELLASGIFNILLVLGIAALVHPLPVAPMLSHFDAPVLVLCALLLVVFMLFGWRLTRLQGALLLIGYFAYIAGVGLRSGIRFHG